MSGTQITIDPYTIPDTDTLKRAADEVLTRPSDAAFWDARMYDTHGPVMSYADRSGEDLGASNLATLADTLGIPVPSSGAGAYRDLPDTGTANADGTAFVASVGHWAVGSLLQIWVQVRADQPHDWADTLDGHASADTLATLAPYTPAFVAAVQAAEAMRDYPILDDSDYSAREWASFDQGLAEAWADAWNDLDNIAGGLNLAPELTAYVEEHVNEEYDGGHGYDYDAAWHVATVGAILDALADAPHGPVVSDDQGVLDLGA